MPSNKKDLKSLHSFFQWFKNFISMLSIKLGPLHRLLKQKTRFQWTQRYTEIIDSIIKEIKKRQSLTLHDLNAKFDIHTDASNLGIAAALSQTSSLSDSSVNVSRKLKSAIIHKKKRFSR